MRPDLILLLAPTLLAAVDAAADAPQVAVQVREATVSLRAEWKGSRWAMVNDDLSLGLAVTATCSRPVLRVDIVRCDEIRDGTGAELATTQGYRLLRERGRWWDHRDETDLGRLTFAGFLPIARPAGDPPAIARIRGLAAVTVGTGSTTTYELPIDGPRRRLAVGATGLEIEVGRTAWGGTPVLGVPRALTDRLRSLVFRSGGRTQLPAGINDGDMQLISIPLAPQAGDTVAITAYDGAERSEVAFELGPIALGGLLGAAAPGPAVEF